MNKILYITSEAFPLIKTGGLADVAGSLPAALIEQSQDIRVLMPAYPEVIRKIKNPKKLAHASYYNFSVSLLETKLPNSRTIIWLVDCPAAFNRPGGPYMDNNSQPWHDNALRFSVLCKLAVDISLNRLQLDWQPDVVHGNDWQSGLVPALLSSYKQRPATVFTVHNLAYQGLFDKQTFLDLDLPKELWQQNGLEFYDQMSFIKGGLVYADRINTVSSRYSKEILEQENGYGLDGLLLYRKDRLSGILNGIDDKIWNPETDRYLEATYNRENLEPKRTNKTSLQKQLGLPVDADMPVIGIVSRLVEQKGFDIILQAIPKILELPVQLIILGTGEVHYEIKLVEWARKHPDKIKVIIGYNEPLSHQIEAGSDLFLMPSSFEPCGLNQLYSLRYGTLPIVRNVGGLADTVFDANKKNIGNNTANGFIIREQTSAALLSTLKRALVTYKKTKLWKQLQITAMSGDFSWKSSAEHYIKLYQQALIDRDKSVS